jgi:hypothetical protein
MLASVAAMQGGSRCGTRSRGVADQAQDGGCRRVHAAQIATVGISQRAIIW